jgi:hypothetical protein
MLNNIALLSHTQHQTLMHVVNGYVKHNSKTFNIDYIKKEIYWIFFNYYQNHKANIIIVFFCGLDIDTILFKVHSKAHRFWEVEVP